MGRKSLINVPMAHGRKDALDHHVLDQSMKAKNPIIVLFVIRIYKTNEKGLLHTARVYEGKNHFQMLLL